MFTVSESRPILLMKILYNSVKRLRDGFASRHFSALSLIYIFFKCDDMQVELKFGFHL